MDGVIDIASARALVSDATLWPRVRDFLWDFAPQVHPSWREEAEGTAAADAEGLAASPRVKRHLLSRLGAENCFHAFPREDGSRLLLLDGATLEAVAGWLGALASADALRKVTGGAEVRALKAALPGVYPDVFAFTAYFAKAGLSAAGAAADPGAIRSTGFALLFSALSGLPAPLLRRLRLKLPKDALPEEPPPRPASLQPISLLLKLRFPEAHALCCS